MVAPKSKTFGIVDFQGALRRLNTLDKTVNNVGVEIRKVPKKGRLLNKTHYYVKQGWHCAFAKYLFKDGMSKGLKKYELKLSDATLNLIDPELLSLKTELEARQMDDELVMAIMSSPKSWEAVQRETGSGYCLDHQAAKSHACGAQETWIIKTLKEGILKHYNALLTQSPSELQAHMARFETEDGKEYDNAIVEVQQFLRNRSVEKAKIEAQRLEEERLANRGICAKVTDGLAAVVNKILPDQLECSDTLKDKVKVFLPGLGHG